MAKLILTVLGEQRVVRKSTRKAPLPKKPGKPKVVKDPRHLCHVRHKVEYVERLEHEQYTQLAHVPAESLEHYWCFSP